MNVVFLAKYSKNFNSCYDKEHTQVLISAAACRELLGTKEFLFAKTQYQFQIPAKP